MNGTILIITVIAISFLPLIPAWFYFRKKEINAFWYCICLGTGFITVMVVLFSRLFFWGPDTAGDVNVFISVFRIPLIEELSRMILFIPLLRVAANKVENFSSVGFGWKAGFIAGLGFAAAESIFITVSDPAVALFRAFGTAPLHGACGARIGKAVCQLQNRSFNSLYLFLSAVLIHGAFNFFIVHPTLSPVFSLVIAIAALLNINRE